MEDETENIDLYELGYPRKGITLQISAYNFEGGKAYTYRAEIFDPQGIEGITKIHPEDEDLKSPQKDLRAK